MNQPAAVHHEDGALVAYTTPDRIMRDNLEHYSRSVVKIQDKDGMIVPFVWNRAQRELHEVLRRQLDEHGWVRAIVLKARQLGISTYVCVRLYARSTMWEGQRTFILTQEDRATQNLFEMVKRVQDNMAVDYRPGLKVSNANELKFADLDGGYRVGTAQNVKGSGRSLTFSHFHGSEVAFWAQPHTHFAGVMRAVPKRPGTEIILESTANGIGGTFHEQWQLAVRGESEFIPFFAPWFWGDDYVQPKPGHLEFTPDEIEYGHAYGLTTEQLTWMHFTCIELGGAPGTIPAMFSQEYPATAAEAFQSTGRNTFITPAMVAQARAYTAPDQSYAPLVLGADIAHGGKSRTRIIDRQGRAAGRAVNITLNSDDTVVIADTIALELNRHPEIRMVFIDVTGGFGAGVYDILRRTFPHRVKGINFGAVPTEPLRYFNKRAEMHARGRDWLNDPAGADIPDDDELHGELCATGYEHDANGRLKMQKKTDAEKDSGLRMDGSDAFFLTFAEELPNVLLEEETREREKLERLHAQQLSRESNSAGWLGA